MKTDAPIVLLMREGPHPGEELTAKVFALGKASQTLRAGSDLFMKNINMSTVGLKEQPSLGGNWRPLFMPRPDFQQLSV